MMNYSVCFWDVFSKSGQYLGTIEAYSKYDAEVLADNVYGDDVKPLTVQLQYGGNNGQ